MFLFSNKKLYMDFASMHPVYSQVLGYLRRVQNIVDVNPSGLCAVNTQARTAITEARKTIAQHLHAQPRQIIFTHTGTEANALALIGVLAKLYNNGNRNMNVFTTAVEHSSVHHVLQHYMHVYSYTVHEMPLVDGIVDVDAFKKMCTELLPVLVSVQYVNNETGIMQPIAEIARVIRHIKKTNKSSVLLLHTDAMQGQYEDLQVDRLGIDLLSLSSGKVGGPRGAALVYSRDPANIVGYLGAGSQEFGKFAGTENTYAILGFAKAIEITRNDWEAKRKTLFEKRNYFTSELKKVIPDCEINEAKNTEAQSVHIVSVSIPNTLSEQLVIELDAKKVITSAKSACEALDGGPSHVLKALHGDTQNDWGTVRFSYNDTLSKNDINRAVKALAQVIKKIRDTQKRFLK